MTNQNKSFMNSITKWLTDPDADDYPFPHKINGRLRSLDKDIEGIVRNAKYSGTQNSDVASITAYGIAGAAQRC